MIKETGIDKKKLKEIDAEARSRLSALRNTTQWLKILYGLQDMGPDITTHAESPSKLTAAYDT